MPDDEVKLADGAIAPWSLGKATTEYWNRLIEGLGKDLGFSMDTRWKDLPAKARNAILNGKDHKVVVQYRNRFGRERKYTTGFEGVIATCTASTRKPSPTTPGTATSSTCARSRARPATERG